MTSGTAGPFVAEPLDIHVHLTIAAANLLVGFYLLTGITGAPAITGQLRARGLPGRRGRSQQRERSAFAFDAAAGLTSVG